MSDDLMKKLDAAWSKIEESTKGYKDSSFKPMTPRGDTPEKVTSGAVEQKRGMGAQPGAKEVKPAEEYGKKGAVDGSIVKPVSREEGVEAGNKEVGEEHGTKAATEGAKPVAREEGSAAGAKEVSKKYEDFRARIRTKLGLSLDDKMNKGYGENGEVPAGKSNR